MSRVSRRIVVPPSRIAPSAGPARSTATVSCTPRAVSSRAAPTCTPRSASTAACTRPAVRASSPRASISSSSRRRPPTAGFGALKCRKDPLEHCPSSIDKAYVHRAEALGCVNPEFFEPVGGDTFRVIARIPIQGCHVEREPGLRAAGGPTRARSRVDALAVLGRASRARRGAPAVAGGRGSAAMPSPISPSPTVRVPVAVRAERHLRVVQVQRAQPVEADLRVERRRGAPSSPPGRRSRCPTRRGGRSRGRHRGAGAGSARSRPPARRPCARSCRRRRRCSRAAARRSSGRSASTLSSSPWMRSRPASSPSPRCEPTCTITASASSSRRDLAAGRERDARLLDDGLVGAREVDQVRGVADDRHVGRGARRRGTPRGSRAGAPVRARRAGSS